MPCYHPVMLCQPDMLKSCSACCGLYNWKDHSRRAVTRIVEIQTGLFRSLDDYTCFDSYRDKRNARIGNEKLFDTIYNCEFIGYIDPDRKKVGCMLHPSVTGDTGLRDNCFYGAKVCTEHFCPGFSCLTTAEQTAVVAALDDWYLYGLVITDIDLVKEFFKHVQASIGDAVRPERIKGIAVRSALHDFFSLKENWPYRASENRLGKYCFSRAEYAIARIEYEKLWGLPPSRFDRILVSLESELSDPAALADAEKIIEEKIDAFITAYTGRL